MNKTKILLIAVGALVGVAAFSFTTMYVDTEDIQSKYLATVNGSYTRKFIKLQDTLTTAEDNAQDSQQGGVAAPNDTNTAAWEAWVKGAKGSDIRKSILIEGLDCYNKGVLYHQIRNLHGETPDKCLVACDGDKYPGAPAYDYATQASYKVPDPLYLDCSFFIKHCYSVAGMEMAATNTDTLLKEFSVIDFNSLVPGDIALRSGHVIMFLGLTSDGQHMWIEMSGHSEDMKMEIKQKETLDASGYTYRRFGALANDTTFVGGTGSNSVTEEAGTKQLTWNTSWEFAHPDMKHPDTINKYVPDNFNGHTIFLNPGHGDGTDLASSVPKDPVSDLGNQYTGSATAGHTSGTAYKTSTGKTVSEAQHVLDVANVVKDKLLAKGYAVIMARESLVNNFENSARSVWANNTADVHIALHIDSGTHGPGWYRPSSKQKQHPNYSKNADRSEKLGLAIEDAMSATLGKPKYTGLNGILTGYSYATIPTVYIEMYGVKSKEMADFADMHIEQAAQGIVDGIDAYFQ